MTVVIVRDQAQEDIEDAAREYLAVAPKIAVDFLYEYDTMTRLIEAFPRMFGKAYRSARLAPLKRFPYNIWYVYLESADAVSILRVTHKRRDDEDIKRRLPEQR